MLHKFLANSGLLLLRQVPGIICSYTSGSTRIAVLFLVELDTKTKLNRVLVVFRIKLIIFKVASDTAFDDAELCR